MSTVVGTDRYPLDDPGGAVWREVVDRARADLRADGATVLRDVVRPGPHGRLRAGGDAVPPTPTPPSPGSSTRRADELRRAVDEISVVIADR
ncbi:hypothetical protein [Actinomycetospora atypica]|uniref:Uncharacterized protein n=1 Tax=Actinomycetospora atypica TaxID=1290095 RepID=A0ABV9YRE5_9PSEU